MLVRNGPQTLRTEIRFSATILTDSAKVQSAADRRQPGGNFECALFDGRFFRFSICYRLVVIRHVCISRLLALRISLSWYRMRAIHDCPEVWGLTFPFDRGCG